MEVLYISVFDLWQGLRLGIKERSHGHEVCVKVWQHGHTSVL